MAVYKSYENSAYAQAASTAAQYLQDSGIFESVTISGETITCTYDGETVATLTLSNGRIDWTFGPWTSYAGDIAVLWIGKAQNGVLIDWTNNFVQSGNALYTLAICKSQSGVPMLIHHEQGTTGNGNVYALTCDAETAPSSTAGPSIGTNSFYSNLCGVCTISSGAETVAAADKAFRYVDRQNGVPVGSMSIISIASTDYLTDGWMAVQD